jgi:PAT family beta-lactamase induction signal transducer AmpG
MILNRAVSVYLDRRLLSVLFLGFSSGLPLALTGSTLSVWLTEGGVSKTSIGLFALAGIPYTLKFAWAPLIDRLRLPVITARLGRRRGWAVVTQILLVLCLLGLGASDPVLDLGWTAVLALAVSFCSASQDVVIDAFRVELLAEEQQGAGAGAVVLGYRAGMMASGAGALYLASFMPWGTVYTVMAAMVAVGTATILANREPSEPSTPESRAIERAAAAYAEAHPRLSGRKAALIAWLYSAVAAPFAQFMTRPAWLAFSPSSPCTSWATPMPE